MADVIYVLVTIGFFSGAAGFVGLCDRIIGRDPQHDPSAEPAPAAAPATAEPAPVVVR